MGAWSASITDNDTAQDLMQEYTAAFYYYEPQEALEKIEQYVRTEMCDESDEETWCDYVYSLADFMWKKGILTDDVKARAINMIDTGFGLEIWEESGQKTLAARKKVLAAFREKLLSDMPPRKRIKPSAHTERIFCDGDFVAIQLQTAGKPYTENKEKPMTDDEFHAMDGKYIIMQLVACRSSWSSRIVPQVQDYWAVFKLFDGVYDAVPNDISLDDLKPVNMHAADMAPYFTCESSMFYFKRRKYQILGNRPIDPGVAATCNTYIFFGVNHQTCNPDSDFLASMGNAVTCAPFTGASQDLQTILFYAVRCGRYNYSLTDQQNEEIFKQEESGIMRNIESALNNGGKLLSIQFGSRPVGMATVNGNKIDNLYIHGQYRNMGLDKQLLEYALSAAGDGAYIVVPKQRKRLMRLCESTPALHVAEGNESDVLFQT